MPQKDNILDELQELKSPLPHHPVQPYTVPAGYFEGLAAAVLLRIKASAAQDSKEEIEILSPLLSKISRAMPYELPGNYFEQLDPGFATISEDAELSGSLLGKMNKEMPYSVPTGYFDRVLNPVAVTPNNTSAKLVNLNNRKWLRYAAAAVITGLIVLAGFYFGNQRESGVKVMAKVTRDVKKMNEVQKDKLLDFIEAGMNGEETVQTNPDNKTAIKNLIEGISDEELKDFHEQTEAMEDVLMTN